MLQRITRSDLSNGAFKWLTSKWIDVGLAPSLCIRMNFVGELWFELHHPIEYQNHIFDAVMAAGSDLGIKPFGIRAMEAMRIEKSYRMVGQEMSIEYAALESGLQRFVHLNKGEFKGREGLTRWQERGFANTFVNMEVHCVTDAYALGSNPIRKDGKVIGRATSGGYGFRIGKSLAMAMVAPEFSELGTDLEIQILGYWYKATVIDESPFDPDNERLRA